MAKPVVGVWGIDVGQCALKALRLEMIEGKVTATAFDYVEHPKILSQPDADPDQLIREALDKFLSRNTLLGDQVAISVPGQSGLARFVKLPPVEEKKINDIVRFEAKQQIPFPLEEVIWDFQKIGSGVVTDGFAMETEIGLFAMKRDMIHRAMQQFKDVNIDVHIVQMAPLALCNFVAFDLLGKGAAGGNGEGGGGDGKRHCVVALDIGTDNSNLVISDGERIIWQRPIPHGGNHFTRALTKDLKLTFAKAEHLKRNATKSPDLKKILSALKPVLNDFVGEVQRSLGYFTNTHRNAQIDYMIGLGNAFRLPGLQKFLGEKLTLDVRKLQKLERLTGDSVVTAPAFTQNVLSFAVAYGLALQGLSQTRLHTNLLPQDVRVERLIKAKKPWAVAAAAALLFGTATMTTGYALQYRAFAAPEVVKAEDAGKSVVDQAKKGKSEFDGKMSSINSEEESVRGIVAGQEDRLNWMVLDRYINDCLPVPGVRVDGKIKAWSKDALELTDRHGQVRKIALTDDPALAVDGQVLAAYHRGPDGKPIPISLVRDRKVLATAMAPGAAVTVLYQPDPFARVYWDRDADKGDAGAQQAFLKLTEQQASGKNSDVRDNGVLKRLVHVNIESINCLYARDLKTYWANATNDSIVKENMLHTLPAQDRADNKPTGEPTPLEGAGWVVELRGYTWSDREPLQFLRDVLINKLAATASKKSDDKTKDADKDHPADPTDIRVAWKRAIEGQITHPFVYQARQYQNADPNQFNLISVSVLGSVVGGGSTVVNTGQGQGLNGPEGVGIMQKGGRGTGGMGGGTSGGYSSLLDDSTTGGGGMFGKGGTPPPGINMPNPKPGIPSPTPPATSAESDKSAENAKPGAARTEFIVLLVWKEPGKDKAAATPVTP